ncbi:hypothetical protein [Parasitella parasitica]|uniref:Pentacotripeptide-repeat region of PRORP domain-containing protein n=1 Tax=Parasitella parasitica TaxID=35722 RepID=A0A0B7MW18_9FUNG|nr:hypothetical protein [Parasitella parasitica]
MTPHTKKPLLAFRNHSLHTKRDITRLHSTQTSANKFSIDSSTGSSESKKLTKKEKYHYLTTKDANGSKKYVKGFTMKDKKKSQMTVEDYNYSMTNAILENRLNKALKLFREMENSGLKPDIQTYTCIINEFAKRCEMDRASKWLKRMKKQKIIPDAHIYTTLIDGYMRQTDLDRAEETFGLMMERNVQPTIVTYNILMHHSVRQLNMESALKFWGNLLDAGLKSDVYTFAIILHGLGDEGRLDEAWRVFQTMQEENIEVNEVVATTLMGMHVKQHDNEYAVQLFNRFFRPSANMLQTSHHTRNVLLNAIIGPADNEKISKYYSLYKDTVSDKSKRDVLFVGANVYTYTTFMRAFLRRDNLPMVSQVYADMVAQRIQPSLVTYATLMLAHAYVPDPESCQRILLELKNNKLELNAVIYTIMMRAWAKAGRWEKVKEVYDDMKNSGIQPTKLTMEVLRYGRARSGDL